MDPIQAAPDEAAQPPLLPYEPGEWGPVEATEWMTRQEREWFDTCPVLT